MFKSKETFENLSWIKIKPCYGPKDVKHATAETPGKFPYTRGIHPTMYREKLWTMRQFAGFGTAKETNARFHELLKLGETGLSTAFDLPTLMGYDSDHSRSLGEVGKCGVAIDSLEDYIRLFKGIRLDQVSVSMTVNGPAAILYSMYVACAKRQNVRLTNLRGTIQNDILKEYMAQHTWVFPPRPQLRLFTDMLKFSLEHTPRYNPISISGYHIREAGASAVQELAFTLANAFAYVEEALKVGLDIDQFAPRFSFFFNAHIDFFEEIAKYRAARRIWAKRLKKKYGAKSERSLKLRFHAQTAGCSLTKQQPENNIIRTALEALSAVLGGAQSLHTNSLDETISLPSQMAVQIALRTQQILAHETGVPNTADPLGGSYYIEWLTDKMEEEAEKYFKQIDDLGGVLQAIEAGFFQKEIKESASIYQRELEEKKRILVGVNQHEETTNVFKVPILQMDEKLEHAQVKSLKEFKRNRPKAPLKRALRRLKQATARKNNLIPVMIQCVESCATEGEIVEALKEVFGEYTPQFSTG